MPLKIEVALYNPPFGSPAARGSRFPQPSLIFDTGGKPRGPALGIAHMLAAAVCLTMPRTARWRVHVDENFTELLGVSSSTRRRVWVELEAGDSAQHALDILTIIAKREGPRAS